MRLKRIKRIIASVTLAATLLCFLPVSADASAVYATIVPDSTEVSRLTYSDGAYLSDVYGKYKNLSARSLSITANKNAVSVAVTSGDDVSGRETLSKIVSKYNKDGKRVIGAINADFFSPETGLPLGVQINKGVIYATNDAPYDKGQGRVSVGINADGTTVFDVPEFEITVNIDGYQITADRINSLPNWSENKATGEVWEPVILLTSDYGAKTNWVTGKAYDVIVLKADGSLMLNDDTTCHYDKFLKNQTSPVAIEKGKVYVIAKAGYFQGFNEPKAPKPSPEDIENGVTPELDDISYVSVMEKSGKWDNVVTAFGAGNLLVSGGVVRYESTYDSSIKSTKTSRTAFGVRADGSYVLYTAERNKGGTIAGVMMEAAAQAMKDMGCVYAVNLDGGGSTTIMADTGEGIKVKNHLQDGSERKIANAILLLSDEKAPEIVEDFEKEKTFTEIYDGTNLVGAKFNKTSPYTASQALEIEYTLADIMQMVGVEFEPIDIKAHSTLMMAVDMNDSAVTLQARLKNAEGVFTRDIVTDGDGYKRATLNVADADELVGFSLVYKKDGKHKSSVLIDRIVGYGNYALTDTKVPELSVKVMDGVLNVTSKKPVFTAGIDPEGAEVRINGGEIIRGNKIDLSEYPSDKINRAKVDAVDVVGNRTTTYTLFKTKDYAQPMPFADMNDKKWDAGALRYCYENKIISGFSEGGQLFAKGGDNVTRAQFCVMIVSQKKLDVNKYLNVKMPYEDIDDIPGWAVPYVRAAYAEGIMTGTKTETGVVFLPSNDITRAEAASALDRLIEKDDRLTKTVTYTDEKDIAKWAKKFVASVSTQGLFEGDKNGCFFPNNNLTRSESAVLMSKL